MNASFAGITEACEDSIQSWIAAVLGVLFAMSEAAPYIKKIEGNGICHAIHAVLTSKCLKARPEPSFS